MKSIGLKLCQRPLRVESKSTQQPLLYCSFNSSRGEVPYASCILYAFSGAAFVCELCLFLILQNFKQKNIKTLNTWNCFLDIE